MRENELSQKRVSFCRKQARNILKRFEVKNGKINIPVPIKKVAEFFEFEIYPLEAIPNAQSAIVIIDKNAGRKIIGFNSNHHENRQRFSIGHELGHFFLGHPSEKDCSNDEIKLYNKEADEFSAEILMPLELLKENIKKNKDVKSLAKLFKVSEGAMWIKIKQQKMLNLILNN